MLFKQPALFNVHKGMWILYETRFDPAAGNRDYPSLMYAFASLRASQIIHDLLRGKWQFLSRPVTHCHLIRSGQSLFPAAFSVEFHALSKSLILCPKDMGVL